MRVTDRSDLRLRQHNCACHDRRNIDVVASRHAPADLGTTADAAVQWPSAADAVSIEA